MAGIKPVYSGFPEFRDGWIGRIFIDLGGIVGAAYVSGKNEHLAIDLLLQHMRPSRRKLLRLFIFLIVFLFAVFVLIVGGAWLVYTRFHLGVTSASLEINLGYVYLALPLGGLLTAYYAIDNAIALFRSSNS